MALNFPDSPTLNQVYTDSTSGFSYQWDGVVWKSYSPSSASQIKILDDFSASFNGVTQSFALTSNGNVITPPSPQSLIINLGGVVQDPTDDYSVSESNIIFSTPPTGGLTFSGVSLGPAVPLNTILDGTVTDGSLRISTTAVVGSATTFTEDLVVQGDARVTGILTVGTSSITLDGSNNTIRVGTGLTLSSSGITGTASSVTATSFYGDGSNLSNIISGVGINTVGGSVGTGATVLDFRGAGISTVTVSSGIATINIEGGGITTSTSINTIGIITASKFYGDGSNLVFDPKVISFSPLAGSTNVGVSTNIIITFDQNIQFSGVGTIFIREGSASGTITTSFTCGVSTGSTIIGSQLTIDPQNNLANGTTYYVVLPSVGIANSTGTFHKGTSSYYFITEQQSFSAQGGNEVLTLVSPTSPTGYYRYHIFTSSGILTTTSSNSAATDFAFVMVAGGGGGGGGSTYGNGGGGAGGHTSKTAPTLPLPAGNYTITIGAGGAGYGPTSSPTDGPNLTVDGNTNGSDSSISGPTITTLTMFGGGRGGTGYSPTSPPSTPLVISRGSPGGSGGGNAGGHSYLGVPVGATTGIPGQGNNGGTSGAPTYDAGSAAIGAGGGGGGAGGAGSNVTGSYPGNWVAGAGGSGTPNPSFPGPSFIGYTPTIPATFWSTIGESGILAGGGGGGARLSPVPSSYGPAAAGQGGSGGGGHGAYVNPALNPFTPQSDPIGPPSLPGQSKANHGLQNSGGGGGGNGNGPSGRGGSGVVMIRYAVPSP